jgi:4'-phosphopantetheinyl transferase
MAGWELPPAAPAVRPGVVDLWRVPLDIPSAALERRAACLSPDERDRARHFRFQVHGNRYVAGRGALRAILARYLAVQPDAVAFSYGAHGKPELAGQAAAELAFNVAHSGDVCLVAVGAESRVGVDVEAVDRGVEIHALARRFFSAAEADALAKLPAPMQREAFFACWTRKEAFIKAVGEGLSMPLDCFRVSLAPGEPPRLLHVDDNPGAPARWTLLAFDAAPDFPAAAAIDRPGVAPRFYDFG